MCKPLHYGCIVNDATSEMLQLVILTYTLHFMLLILQVHQLHELLLVFSDL